MRTIILSIRGLYREPHTIRNVIPFLSVAFVLAIVSMLVANRVDNAILAAIMEVSWIFPAFAFLAFRHGDVVLRCRLLRLCRSFKLHGYDDRRPRLLRRDNVNECLERFRFRSCIPTIEWERRLPQLEMLFQSKIHKVKTSAANIRIIDLYVVKKDLPKLIAWDDSYILDGRKFAVGEGFEGKVIWDAAEMPHGMVAGTSGAGKSATIRCLCYQATRKGFNVCILDFKGGGDFAGFDGTIISEPEAARDVLVSLLAEVRARMAAFRAAGVSNIDEHNALGRELRTPWLFVVDEAAEVFDVKPRDKDEKELYAEIDKTLRTLARMSRAAGVHLLLGIIRPDADVIAGQIKNNLLWRACGYFADPAASRIVLDSDKATTLPPDVKGRFIVGDQEVQTYYFPVPKTAGN